jgi:hypothetical protein
VNAIAALVLVRGPTSCLHLISLSVMLAELFFNPRRAGFNVAAISWVSGCFPSGCWSTGLVSSALSLEVLLMIGTFAYLSNSFTSLVLPQY